MKRYKQYVVCEACGCTAAPDSTYEKTGRGSLFDHDVMRRECQRCGNIWHELPLNAKDDESDESD